MGDLVFQDQKGQKIRNFSSMSNFRASKIKKKLFGTFHDPWESCKCECLTTEAKHDLLQRGDARIGSLLHDTVRDGDYESVHH